ncbi:DUF1990 domain-containing protein [Actinomadura barringtoniae]|uniref:DUF1990 domain-containing protein n=1 Tax=Actinomadura barringtoniae TaxID=1427535 RepID=A0A939P767_9ACTN|nr:DUF1990 domain-containing protein [Actinomadura barringtoniae]MBO2446655.1 DUF1990 domain-containing protein [Actinomadura barringtoniae]
MADGFTYDEVGATEGGALPDGYSHLRVRTLIGNGPDVFRRAADAVLDFRMHRAIPVRIDASAERVAPGVEVTVGLGIGPLRLKAPCKVVWAKDGNHRAGWAYGTLPGHPECGEEAFVVSMDEAGDVWLTVTAFSRPCRVPARIAGPLVPVGQRAYGRRCGAVLRKIAARGGR